MGWDQGIHAWIGGVINAGGLPYRDAWDSSGPLACYLHAVAERIFGANAWGIRVLDLALLALSAYGIARCAGRLTHPGIGHYAGLGLILWYASGGWWHTAQRDGWASMLLLWGLAPVVGGNVQIGWYAWAGATIGSAVLIKPIFGTYVLTAGLSAFFVTESWRVRLAAWVVTLGGFCVPLGIAAAWFALHGAMDDVLEAYVLWPMQVYRETAGGTMWSVRKVVEQALDGRVYCMLLPTALFGLVALWRSSRRVFWVLASWSGLALTGVVVQGRFFDYHWLPLHPSAILLSAVGIHRALQSIPSWRQTFVPIYLGVVGLHLLCYPMFEVWQLLQRFGGSSFRQPWSLCSLAGRARSG